MYNRVDNNKQIDLVHKDKLLITSSFSLLCQQSQNLITFRSVPFQHATGKVEKDQANTF